MIRRVQGHDVRRNVPLRFRQRKPSGLDSSNSNFGSQEVLSLDPGLGASLDSSFSP